MASEKQIKANQQNGRLGTGPKDTSKTRYNALKHALTSKGLTEFDDVERYHLVLKDLIDKTQPVGELENALLASAALDVIRWESAQRHTAEYTEFLLNPAVREKNAADDWLDDSRGRLLDPGFPASIYPATLETLQLYQRYEMHFRNQFRSTMRTLELVQDLRKSKRPKPIPPERTCEASGRRAACSPVLQQNTSLAITAGSVTAASADVMGPQDLTMPAPDPNDDPPSGPCGEPNVPRSKVDIQQPKNVTETLWNSAPRRPLWHQ